MSFDFEFDDITRIYREQNNIVPLVTTVGDAIGNVVDPAIPGKILVRYSQSGQLSMPFSVKAPRHKLNLTPGTPVLLEFDRFGDLYISGYDTAAMTAVGISPLSQVVDTTHVAQQSIVTLLPQPTQPASTTILVKAWIPILNNIRTSYPGGSLDLGVAGEDVIPAAGDQAWIVIALDSDFATLVAVTSTPVSLFDLLDQDSAIQECLDQLSATATPIWALLLSDDQASIEQQDFDNGEDERPVVNIAATASGSAPTVTPFMFHYFSDIISGGSFVIEGTSSFFGNDCYQGSGGNGDTFEQKFFLAAGTYTLKVYGSQAFNRGIVDWYVDGSIVASGQDWYSAGTSTVIQTVSVTIATDGEHTLKGVVNGKNGSSSGYYMALVGYILTP